MNTALALAYASEPNLPVAYLDETYSVDPAHKVRFYAVSAVIIPSASRDSTRNALHEVAQSEYWHTTEELRNDPEHVVEMLRCFASSNAGEQCVVALVAPLEDSDKDGEQGRRKALLALFQCLGQAVKVFVMEERLTRRQSNWDAAVKNEAIAHGYLKPDARLIQASPADEKLLWLPDLTCSAVRQQHLKRSGRFFDEIRTITRVIKTNDRAYNFGAPPK